MKKYTIEEFKNYLKKQDSLGDVMYNLSEDNMDEANKLELYDLTVIELEQTCGACPEQYDAYYKGQIVGYLRLRHGTFRCDYTPTGETVYINYPIGDGIFEPEEREEELNTAKRALINKLKQEGEF